jgi:hypothetical protein
VAAKSGKSKVAGDAPSPRVIFPAVVGHVQFDDGEGLGDSYVRDEALSIMFSI